MHSYTVALRIESVSLDTAQVTKELGLTPTQTRFAGQYRSPKSVFEEALWEFDIAPQQPDVDPENWPHRPQWKSLEKGLQKLLSVFSTHAQHLQGYRREHNVYIWIGHFSSSFCGGPQLSAETLKSLGSFGAQLWIDTYFVEDQEAGH